MAKKSVKKAAKTAKNVKKSNSFAKNAKAKKASAKSKIKPVAAKKKPSLKKAFKKSSPVKATKASSAKAVKKVSNKNAFNKKKSVASKIVSSVKKTAKNIVKKIESVTSSKSKIDYSKAITPLADRIVIRVHEPQKISAGGIILPDVVTSTEGYLKGEVLAVGQGAFSKKGHLQQLDVKIGDVVLFSEYVSTKVNFNNEDLHIVREADILGITQ
ncbi:MAG: GroES family chaperonin [Pseudobdellovibrio sp.]